MRECANEDMSREIFVARKVCAEGFVASEKVWRDGFGKGGARMMEIRRIQHTTLATGC